MSAVLTQPEVTVSSARALEIAAADATRMYRDLSRYEIRIRLEDDGWHVEYSLLHKRLHGGGPHYIINASTGDITSKRYYQ
jgi:hypothetical protein